MATPIKDYNALSAFFVELINRFVAKTPAFFNVIKALSTLLTLLAFVPQFFDITIFGKGYDTYVAISGVVAFIVAQFSVEAKSAKVAQGELPLTAQKDTSL